MKSLFILLLDSLLGVGLISNVLSKQDRACRLRRSRPSVLGSGLRQAAVGKSNKFTNALRTFNACRSGNK
jgi:hypothetical protein